MSTARWIGWTDQLIIEFSVKSRAEREKSLMLVRTLNVTEASLK